MGMNNRHDKLANRLGIILTRLNTGERLYLDELALEFNVSVRTLQRDFNERLGYLPLKRDGAAYSLPSRMLGKQTANDLLAITLSMGLGALFPDSSYLSQTVLSSKEPTPFLFQSPVVEDIVEQSTSFEILIECISNRNCVSFSYKANTYGQVDPYKLINYQGVWYLAAQYNKQLLSFRFVEILQLAQLNIRYKPCGKVVHYITTKQTNWHSFMPDWAATTQKHECINSILFGD